MRDGVIGVELQCEEQGLMSHLAKEKRRGNLHLRMVHEHHLTFAWAIPEGSAGGSIEEGSKMHVLFVSV